MQPTICAALLATLMYQNAPLPAAAQQDWEDSAIGRHFRSWAGYCHPDLLCYAETYHLDGIQADFQFRLTRGVNEPSWTMLLAASAGTPTAPYNVYATIDGTSLAFNTNASIGEFEFPGNFHLLGPNAQQLMDLLGPSTELSFEFIDSKGELHAPRFSLAGYSASLLWIDEQQQRIGSPRVVGIPPAGPMLRRGRGDGRRSVPPELLSIHKRQQDCTPPADRQYDHAVRVAFLEAGRILYLLPCSSSAYNAIFAAYGSRTDGFERLHFADYSDETSWTSTPHLINPEWNQETKTLTTFNKGRGIADCGSIGEWRYSAFGLRLAKFFYKRECDATGDPGDFPLIFEAPPVPALQ